LELNMTTSTLTQQQLTQTITSYVDELAALTDAARISTTMQAYLDTCSRFHNYSWHNTLLILLARPQATQVAGYRRWLTLKRHVSKGEHGIAILAPIFLRRGADDTDGETFLRFKVVYVFDIAQTEGEPLPAPPDWTSPDKNDELQAKLLRFAAEAGIAVTVKALAGSTQGYSQGGSIVLSPEAGTKTLIHELAHELLHQGEAKAERPRTREALEAEAEAVAYVVGRHFGLASLGSPNYLALWHADSAVLRGHLERIVQGSRRLITAVEGQADPAGEEAA
jgi:hypothetical protein